MAPILLPIALAAIAAQCAAASRATPVEQVITLLKQLQAQVEDEGKTEAAEYDKYSCFCKEHSDGKTYAIEKSTKKIEMLDTKIGKLDSEITALNMDVGDLTTSIDKLSGDISTAAQERSKESAAYLKKDADTRGAILALEGAIDALKTSKGAMEGAKVDFAQVKVVTARALSTAQTLPSFKRASDGLAALMQLDLQLEGKQSPPKYAYHSNQIIAILKDLLLNFKQMKKETDTLEFKSMSAHQKSDLNMKNIMKFQEDEKADKLQIVEQKTAEMQAAKEDHAAETKDKNADSAFLQVLTEECETKASQWDQRSKTRSTELTAIAEAIKVLSEGAATTWAANKKLAGVQLRRNPLRIKTGHWVWVNDGDSSRTKAPVSFLQLSSADNRASKRAALQRVESYLVDTAKRLRSSVLTSVAARAHLSGDHFVEIRSIIKDLLARLQGDATAEHSHKSFCDSSMAASVNSRDTAKEKIENLEATSSQLQAENARLLEEVSTLAADIAGLQKSLNEAAQLRRAESEENSKTVATAKEGKAAVELAVNLLSDFYSEPGLSAPAPATASASFMQLKYVPANSDREGKTVGDRAPEIWEGEYSGKYADSKGILGLLQVIGADFQRTIDTVTSEESAAKAGYSTLESDTNDAISEKTKSKETKENRVTDIKVELTEAASSLSEEQALLADADKALANLKVQCINGEETYAERVAQREKEITALKEAHQILDDWQK